MGESPWTSGFSGIEALRLGLVVCADMQSGPLEPMVHLPVASFTCPSFGGRRTPCEKRGDAGEVANPGDVDPLGVTRRYADCATHWSSRPSALVDEETTLIADLGPVDPRPTVPEPGIALAQRLLEATLARDLDESTRARGLVAAGVVLGG